MGAPFWFDNPRPWDNPTIGGMEFPGISEVKVRTVRDIDKKKSPGSTGATITVLGANPAEGEIVVTVWEKDQLATLERIMSVLMPKTGKNKVEPFEIVHPKLKMHNVSKVIISEVDGPNPASLRGAMQVTFKFIEYRAPRADGASTFGSKKKADDLESLDLSGKFFPWSKQGKAERSAAKVAAAEEDWARRNSTSVIAASIQGQSQSSQAFTLPPSKTNTKP